MSDDLADFATVPMGTCSMALMNDRLEFTALEVDCDAYVESTFAVDLTVDAVSVALVEPGGGMDATFSVGLDNGGVYVSLSAGILELGSCNAVEVCTQANSRAFMPATDRHLRLSQVAGLVNAETSAAGSEWSLLGSVAAAGADVTLARVILGTFNESEPVGTIAFGDLEVCPR